MQTSSDPTERSPTGIRTLGRIGREMHVEIVDWSDAWTKPFQLLAKQIENAVGWRALVIEHIGSTSGRGLAAEPIIGMDLIVGSLGGQSQAVSAAHAA